MWSVNSMNDHRHARNIELLMTRNSRRRNNICITWSNRRLVPIQTHLSYWIFFFFIIILSCFIVISSLQTSTNHCLSNLNASCPLLHLRSLVWSNICWSLHRIDIQMKCWSLMYRFRWSNSRQNEQKHSDVHVALQLKKYLSAKLTIDNFEMFYE